jgi:hypothetical protein
MNLCKEAQKNCTGLPRIGPLVPLRHGNCPVPDHDLPCTFGHKQVKTTEILP